MNSYPLPDLMLSNDWADQRRRWLALTEDCLYGHAPREAIIQSTILDSQSLWNGRGTQETVRIFYGPGFRWSFDAVLYIPASPGPHPVITWKVFCKKSRMDFWCNAPYAD